MQLQYVLALIASFSGATAVPSASRRHPSALPVLSRQSTRTRSSGSEGVLTFDTDARVSTSHIASAVAEDAPVSQDGVYGTCLVPTNTSVSDCQAVLGDIAGNEGNISVPPGFCLNWWEGGCRSRVCARNVEFSAPSDWIVATLQSSVLDACIANGKTGVAADCSEYNSTCGTYRLFLETFSE